MTPRDASDDSRWSDLDRPPLNAAALRRGLVREGGLWRAVEVVQRTGSTNTDLVDLATAGKAGEGTVLVAEEQTAGKGRLDRDWTAPARSGLFFSVLLNPAEVPVPRWGWLPLLTGVAVATGLSRAAGVDTALKWPNDLLVTIGGDERKTGGILAERAGDAGVVIGVGINVTLREDELPVPQAGSLALAGAASTDRDPLLRGVLRSLEDWYGRWRAAAGDPLVSDLQETYAAGCATLGKMVRAELPGDRAITGEAVAIDGDGRLVLATEEGVQEPVGAGDIVHLRLA
ncbi:biotin--[acetyl-CoA-carboxylase] ligase [Streptomyces ferrugineus]|uniref:biotin--[biotin carboxyl-carrier protein] ligase n=1 Tax=Streptomyces ferrugineus TaxID=1413221 RepID=A0A7M2SLA0_9ACTN|nr:biotin--[acetyl-CoA-carboxylase] ligase [Streptomyces ferrugineus]QOV35991.1 biotin--[acetyl-CoA-carboxylase] ligase [Streptomyces ferrugineus]